MKISELESKLAELKKLYGDIEVRVWDHECTNHDAILSVDSLTYKGEKAICIDMPEWARDEYN